MDFRCLLCDYSTYRKNNLKKHVLTTNKHKKKLAEYLLGYTNSELQNFITKTCSFIDGECEYSEEFEHIILYNNQVTNYVAPPLKKTSKQNKKLVEHFIPFHKETSKSQNLCKTKKIATKQKKGAQNGAYDCDVCGEHFTRNDNLKRHKRDHCKQKILNNTTIILPKQNIESNEILQARIEQLQSRLEMETEHFRGILAEKERLIGVLREKHKHITTAHFQVIQNNIINMNPIKFLNTYFSKNPTLKDVVQKLDNADIDPSHIQTIQDAFALNKVDIIGKTINEILMHKNMKLIKKQGYLLGAGTCKPVLFCNDGSARKYITKGEPGWDYVSTDGEIDKATQTILTKTAKFTKNNKLLMNKTDRKLVNTAIKRENDWNSRKDNLVKEIMGNDDSSVALVCYEETEENEENKNDAFLEQITGTNFSELCNTEEII